MITDVDAFKSNYGVKRRKPKKRKSTKVSVSPRRMIRRTKKR